MADVSPSVVSLVENGKQTSYSTRTMTALAVALGWTPDSLERILRDEDPVEAAPTEADSDRALRELRAEFEAFKAAVEQRLGQSAS